MTATVQLDLDGPIARVTLDHPERGNALTEEMLESMVSGIPALAEGGARALVIRGRGNAFCGGYDLTRMPTGGKGAAYSEGQHPMMLALDALEGFPGPTVAALDGHAIGGGCLLASVCDLRFAAEGIRWSIPAARLGVVYPERGLRRLVALVGLGRTMEMLLLAEPLDASTGLAWGLYNGVEPPDTFDEQLEHRLAQLARRAPLAVDGIHETLRRAVLPPLDEATLRALNALVERALRSEDVNEGLAARRARRQPEFRGR
ncbi:MAG: enoyl-CoA hydratase/isomerase family protein [Myxococcota bacterium]|nr:enoyl-CoA hydratase/isomerase family protein [Myxococcota bacterium]